MSYSATTIKHQIELELEALFRDRDEEWHQTPSEKFIGNYNAQLNLAKQAMTIGNDDRWPPAVTSADLEISAGYLEIASFYKQIVATLSEFIEPSRDIM